MRTCKSSVVLHAADPSRSKRDAGRGTRDGLVRASPQMGHKSPDSTDWHVRVSFSFGILEKQHCPVEMTGQCFKELGLRPDGR